MGEADARGVPAALGAATTTSWLVQTQRVRPGGARATVDTARALRRGLPVLQANREVRLGADRLPEFLPPTWLDPLRRPRRNPPRRL